MKTIKKTESSSELAVVEKTSAPIIKEIESIEVNSPVTMKEAVELLSRVNQYLDKVTEEKEKVTKPLSQALKAERGRWKPLEDMFERAVDALKRKMIDYQTEEKRRADEEAAKIAARVGEGKGKLKVETAVRKLEEVEKPEEKVGTESGSVQFMTVKCFEVMDVTMLPAEYLLADEVKIRAAMKAGMEVPGVRYFEEQRPKNFR